MPLFAAEWASFVDSYGDSIFIRVLVPWLMSTVFYWTYGLLLLLVDFARAPAFFYRRKLQPRVELNPAGDSFRPPLRKCLLTVLFNQLFVILPGLLMMDWITRTGFIPFVTGIRVERELPSLSEMALHGVFGVLLVELFFFSSHRLLHAAFWSIHKQHHEYKAPIALAAIYAHPLEVFFGNTLAVMGPAFLCSFHAYSWYLGIIIGFFSTQSSHSGYNIEGPVHDLHHQFTNYNYGTLGILDRVFGCYISSPPTKGAQR